MQIEPLENRQLLAADTFSTPFGDAPGELQTAEVQVGQSSAVGLIANGSRDDNHDQVVRIQDPQGGTCTGTLITPQHVLTAAHCVDTKRAGGVGSDRAADFGHQGYTVQVGFDGSGFDLPNLRSSHVAIHPQYVFEGSEDAQGRMTGSFENDVAIITLSSALSSFVGHMPSAGAYQGDNLLKNGDVPKQGLILGYGGTETRRAGWIEIDEVSANEISWVNDLGNESLLQGGDSGGPTYVRQGGQEVIAGIHSNSRRNGQVSTDMKVSSYASWIVTQVHLTGDSSGPRAQVIDYSMPSPGVLDVKIRYTDPSGIYEPSIDVKDVGLVATVDRLSYRIFADSISKTKVSSFEYVVTYRLNAPQLNVSQYTVQLFGNSVLDYAGNVNNESTLRSNYAPFPNNQSGRIGTLIRLDGNQQKFNGFDWRQYMIHQSSHQAANIHSDTEIDTDDWTRLDVGYRLLFVVWRQGSARLVDRPNSSDVVRGVYMQAWTRAWESESDGSYRGKTQILTENLFPLLVLSPNDPRSIQLASGTKLVNSRTHIFGRGELHSWYYITSSSRMANATNADATGGHYNGRGSNPVLQGWKNVYVRVDGRGGNDLDDQHLLTWADFPVKLVRKSYSGRVNSGGAALPGYTPPAPLSDPPNNGSGGNSGGGSVRGVAGRGIISTPLGGGEEVPDPPIDLQSTAEPPELPPQSRWHNSIRPADVDSNGSISLTDAFQAINFIRENRLGELVEEPTGEPPKIDFNNNGRMDITDIFEILEVVRMVVNEGPQEEVQVGIHQPLIQQGVPAAIAPAVESAFELPRLVRDVQQSPSTPPSNPQPALEALVEAGASLRWERRVADVFAKEEEFGWLDELFVEEDASHAFDSLPS